MNRKTAIIILAIVAGFSFGFGAGDAAAGDCADYGEGHCGEGNWEEASNPNNCECAIYCIWDPNTVYEKEPCAV